MSGKQDSKGVSAILRHAPISPQKARLVADQVRGLPVRHALNILEFSNKKVASMIKKVVNSAIANAEHNDGMDIDDLFLRTIYVDQARTQKRLRPRARGRADRLLKRSSHITVTLIEKRG